MGFSLASVIPRELIYIAQIKIKFNLLIQQKVYCDD